MSLILSLMNIHFHLSVLTIIYHFHFAIFQFLLKIDNTVCVYYREIPKLSIYTISRYHKTIIIYKLYLIVNYILFFSYQF